MSDRARHSRLLAHERALGRSIPADGRRRGGHGQVRGYQGRCQTRARRPEGPASALLCAFCSRCLGPGGRTRRGMYRGGDRAVALGEWPERGGGWTMFERERGRNMSHTWVSRVLCRWRRICRGAEVRCC
jgi:hypothetical protein